MRRLLPLLALLLLGSSPLDPRPAVDVCPDQVERNPGARFDLLHDAHGAVLWHGTRPDGSQLLLQSVPSGLRERDSCETWAIGDVLASTEARLVPDGAERQSVTLHASDLPGLTGVVVVRDAEKGHVLAAGPFYLFAPISELERLELGMDRELVAMTAVRKDARSRDEHGVGWHDGSQNLLVADGGLVREAGKSVAMVPRWTDEQGRRCEATPRLAFTVLERGERPVLRGLDAADVPGWGSRLLRGEPVEVELGGYSWRWDVERSTFLVKPPFERERIPWRVVPSCR